MVPAAVAAEERRARRSPLRRRDDRAGAGDRGRDATPSVGAAAGPTCGDGAPDPRREEVKNARHQPRQRPAGGAPFTHSLLRRKLAPSGTRIGGAACARPSVPGLKALHTEQVEMLPKVWTFCELIISSLAPDRKPCELLSGETALRGGSAKGNWTRTQPGEAACSAHVLYCWTFLWCDRAFCGRAGAAADLRTPPRVARTPPARGSCRAGAGGQQPARSGAQRDRGVQGAKLCMEGLPGDRAPSGGEAAPGCRAGMCPPRPTFGRRNGSRNWLSTQPAGRRELRSIPAALAETRAPICGSWPASAPGLSPRPGRTPGPPGPVVAR
uniref:uncharacterized protein LOC118525455 n=1 Tax=Halichoerus grypus TaxID=9711 RepID=UPI001658ECD9|nr:uncharacterized protein LOC118525455 [Halichoerus grypus]